MIFFVMTFTLLFVGFYLLFLGGAVRAVLALVFLGNAANLIVFRFSGLIKNQPAFISEGQTQLSAPYADPLPQALVLTAIVISLGVTLFLAALVAQKNETEESL